MSVSLNMDLGELPNEPEQFYALATVVNIACGGHAGDEPSMTRAATLAVKNRAMICAHPSYPDRANFGRTSLAMDRIQIANAVADQCGALSEIAKRVGGVVSAVKPHGALYHDAAARSDVGEAMIAGATGGLGAIPKTVLGPSYGALRQLCAMSGIRYLVEGFADRGVDANGKLIPRGQPGALITDVTACVQRALTLARGGEVQTICIHSDTPGALELATAVRSALVQAGQLTTS